MGPLQGLRVIELASIGPGPLCCMLLADLGADVVRVDRLEPSGLGVAMDPRHDVNARGRRSVALDLKSEAGRDAVLRLVARADVLVEGFRPGVTEKLGLGPADCQARNPRLVYGRITGFGQTGPLAAAAGHDLNYIALAGVLHAIGPAGGKPVPPLNLVADYGGGALYLAFGVLAALFERQRSGRGQVVDAAMVDGAASLASIFYGLQAAGTWSEARGANLLDGGAPFYDSYETADGRFVSLAPLEPKFFAQLAAALELEPRFVQRQYDRRLWPELRAAIAAAVRRHTRDEWCARLEGSDACFAPVLVVRRSAAARACPGARRFRQRRRRRAARAGAALRPHAGAAAAARARGGRAQRRGAARGRLQRRRGGGAVRGAGGRGSGPMSRGYMPARRSAAGRFAAAAARPTRRPARPGGADAAPRRARRRHAQRRGRLSRRRARRTRPRGARLQPRPRATPRPARWLGLAEGGLDYLVAAVRESFEEVGLLLAQAQTAIDLAALKPWRDRLQTGEVSMADFCRAEGLRLDLRGLVYFSHWLTPPGVPKRFDTRFFAVRRAAGPGGRGRPGRSGGTDVAHAAGGARAAARPEAAAGDAAHAAGPGALRQRRRGAGRGAHAARHRR